MATQPEIQDDNLDLDEALVEEEADTGDDTDDQEVESDDSPEDDGGNADEPEDLSFEGDDDGVPANPPSWAKHLRERTDRVSKENRELKRQLELKTVAEEPEVVVGNRPAFYDDGIDGDEEAFNAALDAWEERKVKKADQDRKREDAQRKAQAEWGTVERRYVDGLARLKVPDKQEAVDTALGDLSGQQKAVILKHADDPARFLAALGKNPARLSEIAAIEDPFALTKAMTRMEGQMKTTKGPRPPEPTRQVRGTPLSSGDKQLSRLEAEAAKTGDRTALIKYKASKEKN